MVGQTTSIGKLSGAGLGDRPPTAIVDINVSNKSGRIVNMS
jgi:hypothetical protein